MSLKGSSTNQFCEECELEDHSSAVARCQVCQQDLCDVHALSHKRSRLTKHHGLVQLDSAEERSKHGLRDTDELSKGHAYHYSCSDQLEHDGRLQSDETNVDSGGNIATDHTSEGTDIDDASEGNVDTEAASKESVLADTRHVETKTFSVESLIKDYEDLMDVVKERKERTDQALVELDVQCKHTGERIHRESERLRILVNRQEAAATCQLETVRKVQQSGLQQFIDKQTCILKAAEERIAWLKEGKPPENEALRLGALKEDGQSVPGGRGDLLFVETPSNVERALANGIGVVTFVDVLALAESCEIDLSDHTAVVGSSTKYTLHARNGRNEMISCHADQAYLKATVRPPGDQPEQRLVIKHNKLPGRFSVVFTPQVVGEHTLSVTAQGKHVCSSPAQITALQYPFLFDESSAQPPHSISLSDDGRTIQATTNAPGCILGNISFSSGRHEWKVRVGGIPSVISTSMHIGVLREDPSSSSKSLSLGWSDYSEGLGLSRRTRRKSLSLPEWHNGDEMTVQVDCQENTVSLISSQGHLIHVHRDITGEMRPFFKLIMPGASVTLLPG